MKNKILLVAFISILCLTEIVAQPTLPGQGAGGGNVEDNPIHLLIYPFLMIGAYLGYKVLQKK